MKKIFPLFAIVLMTTSCDQPSTTLTTEKPITIGDPLFESNAPRMIPFKDVAIALQPTPAMGSYPREAKEKGIHGEILLEVWVDTQGTPTKAAALWGPEELRKGAIEYMLKWRFKPLHYDGGISAYRFRMVMPFRLRDGGQYMQIPKGMVY